MPTTKLTKPTARRRKRARDETDPHHQYAQTPPKKSARLTSAKQLGNGRANLPSDLKPQRKNVTRHDATGKQSAVQHRREHQTAPNNLSHQRSQQERHAASSKKDARRLERRSQRALHDKQRAHADAMIRNSAHQFLWSEYVKWLNENHLPVDDQQQWSPDQVSVIVENGQESLIPYVKKAIGANYLEHTTFRKSKKATPAVAVIALAPSAIRAVQIAKRLYDGQPVGKLFGKHISVDAQQQWLRRACRKTVVPTAAGTAKRVHRLLEDGHMTLDHTVLLVIDFSRDARLRNVLDFPLERNQVFQFLHTFASARVRKGTKIMLTIPENQPVRLEEVNNEAQQPQAADEV